MTLPKAPLKSPLWRIRANPESVGPGTLETLKQYWDRVAVFTAMAYALGYAARSLHAWDFNFGALPGARFEYLVAGFMIAVPVAALAATIWGVYHLGGAIKGWSQAHEQASKTLQHKFFGPMAIIGMFSLALTSFLTDSPRTDAIFTGAMVLFAAGLLFGGVLAAGTDTNREARRDRFDSNSTLHRIAAVLDLVGRMLSSLLAFYFGLVIVLLFLLAAFFGAYALRLVPQEFGGVHSKCAILDLDTEQLSPQVATLLIEPTEVLAEKHAVLRSRMLSVYSTTGPWLVRIHLEKGAADRSFRIAESAVKSVEWVSAATPSSASESCHST